jgi:hypothetical protein
MFQRERKKSIWAFAFEGQYSFYLLINWRLRVDYQWYHNETTIRWRINFSSHGRGVLSLTPKTWVISASKPATSEVTIKVAIKIKQLQQMFFDEFNLPNLFVTTKKSNSSLSRDTRIVSLTSGLKHEPNFRIHSIVE